jgi:muramoyltetrapeptide carboxypeptidase LdcA involved in peptidoglycan recycling
MRRRTPVRPRKPSPGDHVAILSPSAGLPALFPRPYELGLRRLREDFGLVPIEYPTTRRMGATPADRAADIHAAFSDPDIKAVISSIGGDDEITVLPHLDLQVLARNPKPFFGYSDNTCLLAALFEAGVMAYHGGAVMVQLGRPGRMHPLTLDSLRAALFRSGTYELQATDSTSLGSEPLMEPSSGWTWHNGERVAEGIGWGGNLEVLSWLLMADRCIAPPEAYDGAVLFFETSEEMPAAVEVSRILRSMGERGLLARFSAVLVGRAKSWSFARRTTSEEKETYRRSQRDAVLSALEAYAPEAMAVFDVDLGHTDPQLVIPVGGTIRVDGVARRITVEY